MISMHFQQYGAMSETITDTWIKANKLVHDWGYSPNEATDIKLSDMIEQALLEAYAEGRKSVLNEFPSDEEMKIAWTGTGSLAFNMGCNWIKQYLSERVKI